MSQLDKKEIPKIVEKYRNKFPELEKPLLRSMIIAENKWLANKTNPNGYRLLSRYLAKIFKPDALKKKQAKPFQQSSNGLLKLYWTRLFEIAEGGFPDIELIKNLIMLLPPEHKERMLKVVADLGHNHGIEHERDQNREILSQIATIVYNLQTE